MELFNHKNHRNQHYMDWLKKQICVASQEKAQVAHHIRLGTNGGQGLKPSDYFCVPLLNKYHTGGKWAVHNMGEESFLKHFNLCKEKIFIHYLHLYLSEHYNLKFDHDLLRSQNYETSIAELIEEIEKRKLKEHEPEKIELPSITESEFYQQAKEAKRIKDKELRKKAKEYSNDLPKIQSLKPPETDYYQKAKQARKDYEKKLRDQLKEKQSEYRKAQYRKLKERG